ncbi:hypothetical protein MLD38_009109 [Melastoma candidum]|uniref:Uncharacterized protein n=1 Tax=Melastoma candidum TaxID=119954 RepID=A0ACB9RWG5_9MYRT|nr:hypothetical protein MLD38_009109 [Melastoma candidum]
MIEQTISEILLAGKGISFYHVLEAVPYQGPLPFRLSAVQLGVWLSASDGEYNLGFTHSVVLEFTADEGVVGLPPEVWNNLFRSGFSCNSLSRELKPSSSVSVLETDVEVDIVSPDSASGMVDEHALIPLKLGDSESALHQHEGSSHDVGSKSMILTSMHKGLGSGNFGIGVTVSGAPQNIICQFKFTITKSHRDKKLQHPHLKWKCKNCKRQIPSRTIALHEAYCSRHNIVCQHVSCGIVLSVEDALKHVHCEKCGQALQKVEMEKHMKVFHEPLHCPCGALEKEQMVSVSFWIQ